MAKIGRPISCEYVVYKGDDFICMGTAKECAEALGIKEKSFRWYLNPVYQERVSNRKWSKNALQVIKMED